MLISAEGTDKNRLEPGQEAWGMLKCCHVVLSNKSLSNTDRYAGTLSWRGNQMFPHFAGSFLLAAFLRRWSTSMYIPYSQCISCKLYQRFESTTYCAILIQCSSNHRLRPPLLCLTYGTKRRKASTHNSP